MSKRIKKNIFLYITQEKAHFLCIMNIVIYEIQGGMNHFKGVCFAAYTGNP